MASQADRREPTAKGYHTGSLERGKSVAARFANVSGLQGVYLKKAGSRAAVTDSVLIGLNPVPMATKVSGMTAEMPSRMALAPRSWTPLDRPDKPSARKVVSLDPFSALGPGQDSALGIE